MCALSLAKAADVKIEESGKKRRVGPENDEYGTFNKTISNSWVASQPTGDGVGLPMAFHFGSVSCCGSSHRNNAAARYPAWGCIDWFKKELLYRGRFILFYFIETCIVRESLWTCVKMYPLVYLRCGRGKGKTHGCGSVGYLS